jgi:ATP-binding cassette subfamily B protein
MTFRKQCGFVGSYVRPYRGRLALGIAAIVARDLVAFTAPLLVREGVNALTGPPSPARWTIGAVSLAMAAVAIVRFAFQTSARLCLMTTSRDVEYQMRGNLLRHLFRLHSEFWARTRVGDAMAYATNDLNAVRMMVGPGASSLSESAVALPIALCIMATVSWKLTLAALLPAPLAAWIVTRAGRVIRQRFDAIQALFSTMSAAVQQGVSGVRVVRAFVQEKAEVRRFEAMNQSYVAANRGLAVYSSSLDPLLTFVTGISVLIVLWYGGSLVLAARLSVGNFVMFTAYTAMLARPIASLGRAVNVIQRGMASAGRLQRLFEERPAIVSGAGDSDVAIGVRPRGAVTFDRVTVRFGSLTALRSVSFEIPAGSTLAILGPTGAGKSTLARLVPRLIDPTEGGVLIDGTDCRDLDLDELRSWVGMVPQETFLFSATLAENISLGAPEMSRGRILEAAEIAGLAPDLQVFPAGMDTVVGERGIMLSGGQKQRISLARAILRRPRILILDDTLSSVDALTGQRILDRLRSVTSERTTLLITHRVATAMCADRIVVLQDGRIAERGSHQQLLANDGFYSRLARLQTIEQELEAL